MGRNRIEINQDDLEKLCAMQCTIEELSAFFDCSIDTIERRVKEWSGLNFAEYYKQKSQIGKIALRRKMYQSAMDKNTTMQIFLSKQKTWLGFTDRVESRSEVSGVNGGPISITSMTQDEKNAEIERLLKIRELGKDE